jgi:hypothetical protein
MAPPAATASSNPIQKWLRDDRVTESVPEGLLSDNTLDISLIASKPLPNSTFAGHRQLHMASRNPPSAIRPSRRHHEPQAGTPERFFRVLQDHQL